MTIEAIQPGDYKCARSNFYGIMIQNKVTSSMDLTDLRIATLRNLAQCRATFKKYNCADGCKLAQFASELKKLQK